MRVGPGEAYCQGRRVPGMAQFDIGAQPDGWVALLVDPTDEVAIQVRAHFPPFCLPLYLIMLDSGRVRAVRDVRRWLHVASWWEGLDGTHNPAFAFWPGSEFAIQRVQPATRVIDRHGRLGWALSYMMVPQQQIIAADDVWRFEASTERIGYGGFAVAIEGTYC